MSWTAIIFDFDGVIVDSEIVSNAVLAQGLTGLGHPTTPEQAADRYIGLNWADTSAAIEAEIGGPLPEDFRETTEALFRSRLEEIGAVQGVADFLEAVEALPKAVASSSPSAWLAAALERLGLARYFAGRVFSAAEHVSRGKPHPDIYLHAARALGQESSRILVIEDTAIGVRAAKAAGMTVVGLCAGLHCGEGYGERLRSAGADHVAASYNQILELLK